MRIRFLMALGASSGLLALAERRPVAQQPPAPPPAPRPEARLRPADQQRAGQGRRGRRPIAEAKKNNWRMAISDRRAAGELVYFEKMDGTQIASIELAQRKARTAVLFRLPARRSPTNSPPATRLS